MSERGQASVELLGGLPLLLLLGLFLFQLLAVGYSAVLAGNAAEAAALAVAGGGSAEKAARQGLPGWSRAGMEVKSRTGRIEVVLKPPSPIPALGSALRVRAEAAIEP